MRSIFFLSFLLFLIVLPLQASSEIDFLKASLHGDVEKMGAFLNKEGSRLVHLRDKDDNTPLHLAAHGQKEKGKKGGAALLILFGSDVNATNRFGSTPLHIASSTNNLEAVKALLGKEGIHPNLPGMHNFTPLHLAVMNRFPLIIIELLKHKDILPNAATNEGTTALHLAAIWGFKEEAEILLADLRTNPNAVQNQVDFIGSTPLHLAAMQAKPEIVALLLQRKETKVDLPIQEGLYKGYTPLHFAAANPDTLNVFQTIKYLIKGGADVKRKNQNGLRPRDLTQISVIQTLLDHPESDFELKHKGPQK